MPAAVKSSTVRRRKPKARARLKAIPRIWEQAQVSPGRDPEIWRLDRSGALIKKSDYGNRYTRYGWEIEYVIPRGRGGSDDPSNLRPVQWERKASQSGVSRR